MNASRLTVSISIIIQRLHRVTIAWYVTIARCVPIARYSYGAAARAFGASKWGGFRTVFFPLTIDGVIAGGLLVLLMSLGFFITPALVGGPSDILIANVISDHVNQTLNWNLAAALSAVLLVIGTAMVLAVLIVILGVRRFHKRAL